MTTTEPTQPQALAATAPETAPTAPQTDEQAKVRGKSHTEPQTGSQGPLDLDAIRAAWLRACGPCDAGYPTACTCPPADPRNVIDALAAEIDRLRDDCAQLRSQLAEAREALVRVAKTLGWDAPPEQVPSGIPDLAIAVQQLRHERDQARTVLAETRQERDQALCAITKIAEVLGSNHVPIAEAP